MAFRPITGGYPERPCFKAFLGHSGVHPGTAMPDFTGVAVQGSPQGHPEQPKMTHTNLGLEVRTIRTSPAIHIQISGFSCTYK